MKKVFGVICILLLICLVLTVVGAGVLVLFEGQRVLNLPVMWVSQSGSNGATPYGEAGKCGYNFKGASLNNSFVIESDGFDVTVHTIDTSDPSIFPANSQYDLFVCYSYNLMGFTTDKDPVTKAGVKIDVSTGNVVINTVQPGGWMLTNDCTIDVYIPKTRTKNMVATIKTGGKVLVEEGIKEISNLTVESSSSKANNVIVKSPVQNFTLISPNGSGDYGTFTGNLTIDSKYGSFSFDKINGSVTAKGTSMDLTITELTGDLTYEVEYGRGNFTTIGGTASFKSIGTHVVAKYIDKSITIDSTGNSYYEIKNNGTEFGGSSNHITMDKGKGTLKLSNSYYKTTVKATDGDITINNAKDIVVVNDKNMTKAKANVVVSMANDSEINTSTSTGAVLTIYTGGNITAKNLSRMVNIEGLGNKDIYAEFAKVNNVSTIKAADAEIILKVPNDQNFAVKAEVEGSSESQAKAKVNFNVAGITTPSNAQFNSAYQTYTLTYAVGSTGVTSNYSVNVLTRETVKVSSLIK